MIAGTWGEPMPQEPGPEQDQWLRVRGWGSIEEWQDRNKDEVPEDRDQEPSR